MADEPMEEDMNLSTELLLRYEYLVRFHENQLAIDSTTDPDALREREARKKELNDWIASHSDRH